MKRDVDNDRFTGPKSWTHFQNALFQMTGKELVVPRRNVSQASSGWSPSKERILRA